jgi:hypothetical protein
VPENNHNAFALLGIIALAQTDVAAGRTAFTNAIAHADALLARTPELYDALDARGIALCGLVLVGAHSGAPIQINDAVATFRRARTINRDAGVVARVIRQLDALARAHPNGPALLAEARLAAAGEEAVEPHLPDGSNP